MPAAACDRLSCSRRIETALNRDVEFDSILWLVGAIGRVATAGAVGIWRHGRLAYSFVCLYGDRWPIRTSKHQSCLQNNLYYFWNILSAATVGKDIWCDVNLSWSLCDDGCGRAMNIKMEDGILINAACRPPRLTDWAALATLKRHFTLV